MKTVPEDTNGDNFIDLDADDLDEASDESETIKITKEDLDDDSEAVPAAAEDYPGVDAADCGAKKDAGLVRMTAICSSNAEAFAVLWEQVEAGLFDVARVETAGAEAKKDARKDTAAVEGNFSLRAFPGCPYCGAQRMSVCEECGVTICEGGVTTNLLGRTALKCPACGNRGLVEGEAGRIWGVGGKSQRKNRGRPGKK